MRCHPRTKTNLYEELRALGECCDQCEDMRNGLEADSDDDRVAYLMLELYSVRYEFMSQDLSLILGLGHDQMLV